MGDWWDCVSDCAALFWAVYEDEWGELFVGVLCILRSNIDSWIFQGGIVSGRQSREQTVEVSC